jgi:hypothetical protein
MTIANIGAITQTHCKAEMTAIATFHVIRWKSMLGMAQALVWDRVRYRRSAGMLFLRVLGTGRGSSTAPGTEFGRTALFCVFNDESSADAFIGRVQSRRHTSESWHVKLRGAGGHGSWRGRDIPTILGAGHPSAAAQLDSPLAMITRADVRPRSWRAFSRDAHVVDKELHTSDGLLAVVGIGEAPVLRLGTFSLWRDAEAIRKFAFGRPEHSRVVQRTRQENWYGEEMFARFVPYWSAGTWDGRDPLRNV